MFKRKPKIEIKKTKKSKKIPIIIIILILLIAAVYFNFFYTVKCKNKYCFDVELVKCRRASFLNEQEGASWLYIIKGASKDTCIVYVKNLNLQSEKAEEIKDKSMLCYLPKGAALAPEANVDLCHGLLKEALQDIIIEKLHLYIAQNIGKITEELKKPF